jgi:hypothetical protein
VGDRLWRTWKLFAPNDLSTNGMRPWLPTRNICFEVTRSSPRQRRIGGFSLRRSKSVAGRATEGGHKSNDLQRVYWKVPWTGGIGTSSAMGRTGPPPDYWRLHPPPPQAPLRNPAQAEVRKPASERRRAPLTRHPAKRFQPERTRHPARAIPR